MESTPKKLKRETVDVTCSILNLGGIQESPSKGGGKNIKYCAFGTVSNKSKTVKRSVSFEPLHYKYLNSTNLKDVVNNEYKAIILKDVIVNDNDEGYKMNANSSFGDIVDLETPFTIQNPPKSSIFDILYKHKIETMVSLTAQVMEYNVETTFLKKVVVHTYMIADNNDKIKMSSFLKLDLKVGDTYDLFNVKIEVYDNTRALRYDVTSTYKTSVEVYGITNDEQLHKVIKPTSMKLNDIKAINKCSFCSEDVVVDKDNYYDCICGNSGTVRNAPKKIYDIVAIDNEETMLHLSIHEEFFNKVVDSKKAFITNTWKVTLNENIIETLEKVDA